ncbi:hypothetical protein V6Z12_A02G118400 [Gossypium hirsutum]
MPYNAPTCYCLVVPVPVSLSPTSRCATLLFSISILHCQVKTLTGQTQLFLNVWIFSNRPLQLGFLLRIFLIYESGRFKGGGVTVSFPRYYLLLDDERMRVT